MYPASCILLLSIFILRHCGNPFSIPRAFLQTFYWFIPSMPRTLTVPVGFAGHAPHIEFEFTSTCPPATILHANSFSTIVPPASWFASSSVFTSRYPYSHRRSRRSNRRGDQNHLSEWQTSRIHSPHEEIRADEPACPGCIWVGVLYGNISLAAGLLGHPWKELVELIYPEISGQETCHLFVHRTAHEANQEVGLTHQISLQRLAHYDHPPVHYPDLNMMGRRAFLGCSSSTS